MKKQNFLKIISSVLVFTFTANQVIWGQEYLASAPQNPQTYKEVSEDTEPVSSSLDQASIEETSQRFLEDSLTLTPATEEKQEKTEVVSEKEKVAQDLKVYDFERYDFQDAKELLREEFAAAVILKDLKKEDLEELVNLSFETGVLVLNGEIVLFTSGSQDEVGVLPAVKALTEKASFISHTHPSIYSHEGPSGQDINEAVEAPEEEYVLTRKGTYAYNNKGVLNGGETFSYDGYIEKLYAALEASIEARDQVAARAELNLFIAEQDRYNEAEEDERVTLRRGGSLASTAGLTSSSITTFSGSPYPYLTPGSTAATALSSSSSTQFLLGYSVPNAGNSSGFTISFDNASTAAVETQNISSLANLTFGLLGPNTSAKLEVVDINGNKDTWTLTGITTAEKFWRLPVSSIANTLDKTKIKQFNFIVDQSTTTTTTRTGTFTVRTGGLNVSNPSKPVVSPAAPANTNLTVLPLSGTKEANTAILINGVQVVPADSSTTWNTNFSLTAEGNNSISITAKSAIGKISSAESFTVKRDTVVPVINTFKINNDSSLYALSSPVTLTFSVTESGSGMDKMSFSLDNVNWSTPVNYSASSSYPLSGDGSKTIYARVYDKAGNVSAVTSKTIILDTVAPTGTIKVNGGVQAINQTAVTLNLLGVDDGSGMYQMSFSTNNSTWSTAEAYAPTKSWTFPAGDGNKTVYVKFWDKANRLSPTPNASVTVLLDTVAPTGSINLTGNPSAALTKDRDITLNLSADPGTGSVINTMSFSTDNTSWSTPETYSQSKNFTLPSGDGTKTVYVKYYDLAGNVSAVYSKSIVLDMTPPVGTIQVTGDPVFNNPGFQVNLALTGTDGAQSAQGMRFSSDAGQTWTSWENFSASKQLTINAQGGEKQILYQFRDTAGNVSEKQTSVLLPHVFEAENMQINQNYWINQSGGTVLLWSNAEASENRLIQESGIYEIEVIAMGIEGEGGAPLLQARLDNSDMGTVSVPYGNGTYTSYKFSGVEVDAGTRKISVAYVNDTGVRDLWIDRIILRKVSDFPPQERIVIQAVDMQTQNGTWNGGTYVSMWGNGRIFDEQEIAEGGLYDIEVYASSNATGNPAVNMQLTADNRQFTEPVAVYANYWSYKKFVYQDVELDAGNPQLSITTADWLNGQTLGIQKIVLKRKGDLPAEEKRIRIEAETMQSSTGGSYVGGWSLWSNGNLQDTLNVPEAGIYAIDVYAFGQSAAGVNPLMDVLLDGNTIASDISVANHHWSYDDYRISGVSLAAGNHDISISYKNDYYGGSWETDRNLYVDKVIFRQLAKYEDVINGGALYAVNRNVNFNLDAVDSELDWSSVRFSQDGGTTWGNWSNYESPAALTLSEDNGMKTVWFQLRTAEGAVSTFADTILLDTAEPAGSIKINNGANYTGVRDVTLTLTASDPASGLDKMRFSTDGGTTWSNWEDIASTKNLTLPAGEGSKEVRYQIRDKASNIATYTDTITLDLTAPVVNLKINNGTNYTGTAQVVLNITASDALSGLGQMRFTTDTVNWVWTEWEDFQTTKNFTLPAANGLTKVFMQLYDQVWNHETVFDEIYLDTVNPSGSISINSGANYTAAAGVTLNLSGQDSGSGIEKMSFSTDNTQWSTPETYAAEKSFNLPAGDGSKTVYVKYFDFAGNSSPVYSKSIVLDTAAPTSTFVINNDEPTTASRDVTFTLGGSDATSGIDQMRFSFDGAATWSNWETFASSKQVTLPEGLGVKQVHFQLRDKAGNISASITDSIEVVQGTGIVFTSSNVSSQQDYALTYTLNGVSVTENWKLAPGQNDLLVRANVNGTLIYAKHTVTWNQAVPSFPTMPTIPALPEDLVSVTSESGHVLKYSEGELISVEKPGEYELFLPELDEDGNLIGGVLRYLSGDLVLLQNSKSYYGVSAAGEKTLYGTSGRIEHFQSADGKRARFAYRVNASGNTVSLLNFEETAASLYENGLPAWIVMQDGTEIRYDNGFLKDYTDAAGNRFTYTTQTIQTQGILTGYSSQLVSVTPSGSSGAVSISTILSNLSNYPSIKATLENKLALTLEYDAAKKMKKFVSGKNETLTLTDGLPAALTTNAGQVSIQGVSNASGELASLAFTQNSLGQTYDESGQLTGITLSDGTVLGVQNQVLSEISLSDGSKLNGLKWNGTILVDFVRTRADGGQEIYAAQKLIKKIDPNGTVTTYIRVNGVDRPDMMTMPDGRTYHFIEYQNAQGLTERISELVSMDMEDGSRIEFKNGKPFRYIQKKQVERSPLEIPELPQGQSYIPLVTLENAEMRSLTIDVNATILSGEILFRDGTQFFIRNGELYKQITPDGKIIETTNEDLPPAETFPSTQPDPLNAQELAYRNQLVDAQMDFFINGIGIDPLTGFPMDNYDGLSGTQSAYSQTTLVGMWAEILAAVARGDYQTSRMTSVEAYQKLEQILDNLVDVQTQAGWFGMFSFFGIEHSEEPVLGPTGLPTGQTTTVTTYKRQFGDIGIGDNLNLSVSLASVIGALSGINNPATNNMRDNIMAYAQLILSKQSIGYDKFYDPAAKRLRMARVFNQNGTEQFSGYMDRVFNEFRTGMIWLAAQDPKYKEAVSNLDVAIRPYETSDGRIIDNTVPYDGGSFQMFWPLIHVDETKYPEFDAALKNFLYTQADFVKRNEVPGLLSAGAVPGMSYQGKIGVPGAAETDDPLFTDTGSIYGTAAAFLLAPHYTLQFLKNLETSFPGIRSSIGYTDAVKLRDVIHVDPVTGEQTVTREPVFADQYYGVDQASFMLSLLGTSRNYFGNYLQNKGIAQSFDQIYSSMVFGLAPAAEENPEAPDFNPAGTPQLSSELNSDGLSHALVKRGAFISSVNDPELGEGKIYDYLTPNGKFHHTEIEFENRSYGLQEYILLPGRGDSARSLAEGLRYDLLNEGVSQGVFYTPNQGYANNALTADSRLGEVHRLSFDFKSIDKPVGLWAQYNGLDLTRYDYLSIPIKLGSNTPEGVRLKFELKGMGQVYISPEITDEWQFVQIPISKPAGLLNEIAVSVQTPDGEPLAGEILLGAFSAFKVRASNQIDWLVTLGKTDTEMRNLLKQIAVQQPSLGGGMVEAEEILENFTLDHAGKLVSGILRLADGGIQYYQNGLLNKWVFVNGRTVLFEKGLATFALDLARGQLEEGRFYYDKSFAGQIRSFVLQDNDRKRIYGGDGKLVTMIDSGHTVQFTNGVMSSITTPEGVLTEMEFADDGSLLKAHVTLTDGTEFDIDQTSDEQMVLRPNGVKIYYRDNRVHAIETPQNGRTEFTYSYNSVAQLLGVNATFNETVTDPVTGQPVIVPRTMALFDYLRIPGRNLEKGEIIKEVKTLLPGAFVGDFTVPGLPFAEANYARTSYTTGFSYDFFLREYSQPGDLMGYLFKYQNTSGPILGAVINHQNDPVALGSYDFINITLRQAPDMDWNQDFNLRLKSQQSSTLYSFELQNAVNTPRTFSFSLDGKVGTETQLTLELVRESGGVADWGRVYVQDISYASLKSLDKPFWQESLSISQEDLRSIKNESDALISVGAEVASGKPRTYTNLVSYLDLPSWVIYTDRSTSETGQLVSFKRFDGSEIFVDENKSVTKMILPDGTVNEYAPVASGAQNVIQGPGSSDQETADYRYGEIRTVTQSNGRIYNFAYEFDEAGTEVTIMKDSVSGEERRFKNGQLLQSANDGLETKYTYAEGALTSANMIYKNRVLESTSYFYAPEETLVKDERGTTWYYDNNGILIKHLTKDGYLYHYSNYTFEPEAGLDLPENDYKRTLFGTEDLRAVTFAGYESADGSQLIVDSLLGDGGAELNFINGDHGVNLELDGERKIKSGQIQFKDGLIVEIENYIPVRGRLATGDLFSLSVPVGESYELLQDSTGAYLGTRVKTGGKLYSYDANGRLVRSENESGESDTFTYTLNASGIPTAYQQTHNVQLAFSGVPYPKTVDLIGGSTQKILDSGTEVISHDGNGFVISVFKEDINQWDSISGNFTSPADRFTLEHFLQEIKPGQAVAMMVSDTSFANAGNSILTLLEGLGAGQVRSASAANQTWAFFGNESLSSGQAAEKVGSGSFSTLTKTITNGTIPAGTTPLFGAQPLVMGMNATISTAYDRFLKNYEALKPSADTFSVSVYDKNENTVFTRRIDGVFSYYEKGKVRETFNARGELLSVHEYICTGECETGDDMELSRIRLVKARADFEKEAAELEEKIEKAKYDALYRLAWQDEAARLRIQEEVDGAMIAISQQISSLESQRYQNVKQCGKGFLGFGKKCKTYTVEVPGVAEAISSLHSQRSDILRAQETELANIPGEVAEKKLEIEDATAQRLAEVAAKRQEILDDMLRQEVEPILMDYYRRILGRDPSTAEVNSWLERSRSTEALNIPVLNSELAALPERTARIDQKTAIITGVKTFLNQYLAAAPEQKAQMLASLKLTSSETINIEQIDLDGVFDYLDSRSLHFGQSAFGALQEMLKSKGAQVSLETLGTQTLLIDILTGVINRFADGELVLSMFALSRTAKIHGQDFASVKYSLQNLKDFYLAICPPSAETCGLRMIAHVGEDHFVTITRVTATEVVMFEVSKGAQGEEKRVSHDEFMKVWNVDNGQGYLLVDHQQVIEAKRITDLQAQKIRGAFWPLFFFIASLILSVASVAVSYISPTLGKILGYAAMVAGIAGIVASVGSVVVNGLKAAYTAIQSQGFFATIRAGLTAVGKFIMSPVKYIGRFINSGFSFSKDGFMEGLSKLSSGITRVKDFLLTPKGRIIFDIHHNEIQLFSQSQIAARTLIAPVLNYTLSKGLEGLGLNPTIARLAGAFVSAGFSGVGGAASNFLKSGLQGLLMQGVSEIGLKLNLPPPVTSALSLLAGSSLQNWFDPTLTLRETLTPILPQVAKQLTLGGVELLGRSLGWNPNLSRLLGLPIAGIIGGITSGLVNHNSILNSITEALFSREMAGGIISATANLAANQWGTAPVLIALVGGKLLTSAIGGFLTKGNQGDFVSVVSGIIGGGTGFVKNLVSGVIADAPELIASLQEGESLGDVFERYALGMLARSTLEDVIGIYGSVKAAYDQGKQQSRIVTLRPGVEAREIQMGTTKEPMTVWESLDGTKTLRIETKDRIVEGDDIKIVGQNFVLTSGTVTYKNSGTGAVIHEVYENNQLLQRQVIGDNQFVDMYGSGRTSSGAANPLKFDQLGNIVDGIVENLASGERVIYSAQTIRIEKSDKRLFSQESNGLNYWFSYGGGNIQFEEYDRATGQLISKGDTAKQTASNNTVFVTKAGQMPGVNSQSVQTSSGTTKQPDPVSQQNRQKAEELLKEKFGTQFSLSGASGAQIPADYRQETINQILSTTNAEEFDEKLNQFLLGNYGQAEGDLLLEQIRLANNEGKSEYGSNFNLGAKWGIFEGEIDFTVSNNEARTGKYEFAFVKPGSRQDLLGNFLGINADISVGAGGKITATEFNRTLPSFGISTSVEQDIPLNPFSGMVGLGNNLFSSFFRDNEGNTIAQKTGVQFVESNFFAEAEGVLGKGNALFQGSFAQGVSTTFNIPHPDPEIGGKLMSLNTKVVREDGVIKAKITLGDIGVSGNPDIRAQLTLEASITSEDANNSEKRQSFTESFNAQLNAIVSQVGGGTWIPGAGGILGGAMHQISDVVASQLFEVNQMTQRSVSIDDLLSGKTDLVGKLDAAFLDDLLRKSSNGIKIISF